MRIECKNPQSVVMEAFFLAYQACGGAMGMGALQARIVVTRDQVWGNVQCNGDYPADLRNLKPGDAYGDYVFGRMMKLGIKWDEASVTVNDGKPRVNYQSWCRVYPTYTALILAAMTNIEKEVMTKVEAPAIA